MEIEVDYKSITSIISKLDKLGKEISTDTILLELAQQVKDMIFLRTFTSKDIDGNSFLPYTPKYAEKKGVATSAVNLYSQKTGNHMMHDMAVRIISNEASEVYFKSKGKSELALRHNTGDIRGGKKRKFFGVNNDEIGKVIATYQKHIQNTLRGLQLA